MLLLWLAIVWENGTRYDSMYLPLWKQREGHTGMAQMLIDLKIKPMAPGCEPSILFTTYPVTPTFQSILTVADKAGFLGFYFFIFFPTGNTNS